MTLAVPADYLQAQCAKKANLLGELGPGLDTTQTSSPMEEMAVMISAMTRSERLFCKSQMSYALFQAYSLLLLSYPDEMPLTRRLAWVMVGTEVGLAFCRTGRRYVFQFWTSGRLLTAFRIWLKPPTKMMKTMLSPRVMSFHRKMSLSSTFQFFLRSQENSMTDFLTDSQRVEGMSILFVDNRFIIKMV